jgi:hypothetical protein
MHMQQQRLRLLNRANSGLAAAQCLQSLRTARRFLQAKHTALQLATKT